MRSFIVLDPNKEPISSGPKGPRAFRSTITEVSILEDKGLAKRFSASKIASTPLYTKRGKRDSRENPSEKQAKT